LRVKVLLGEVPKVPREAVEKAIREAGMRPTSRGADIGVVVGGDGIFSKYGRIESVPLLLVGVRSSGATGSKAYLAATYFDELPAALRTIASGNFTINEQKRLKVVRDGKILDEVFTDVYLQRGAESNCIRYRLKVTGRGTEIEDAAIGDGVVVCTSAGSTGYYSYPDRIGGSEVHPDAYSRIGDNEVGICHIAPTYTERKGSGGHPLRYSVPWGCRIELWVSRPSDARLYGVDPGRRGLRISRNERITILPGQSSTKVITLRK